MYARYEVYLFRGCMEAVTMVLSPLQGAFSEFLEQYATTKKEKEAQEDKEKDENDKEAQIFGTSRKSDKGAKLLGSSVSKPITGNLRRSSITSMGKLHTKTFDHRTLRHFLLQVAVRARWLARSRRRPSNRCRFSP